MGHLTARLRHYQAKYAQVQEDHVAGSSAHDMALGIKTGVELGLGVVQHWLKGLPKGNPRRPFFPGIKNSYMESDRDFVNNNFELCVILLREVGLDPEYEETDEDTCNTPR